MVQLDRETGTAYLLAAAAAATTAAVVSYLLTPVVQRLALRCGAAHEPRARDMHTRPVARWGGLAIYAAFVVAVCLTVALAHFMLGRVIVWRTVKAGLGLLLGGTI